jgi:hypothetical protein
MESSRITSSIFSSPENPYHHIGVWNEGNNDWFTNGKQSGSCRSKQRRCGHSPKQLTQSYSAIV